MPGDAIERIFARCEPHVAELARRVIASVGARVDPKQGSIHLCRRSAFAGLHPRRSALLLNLRTASPLDSPRIRKIERVSAKRYHNELLLSSPAELDEQVIGWLGEAAALADE